jgi:hypothetical protein
MRLGIGDAGKGQGERFGAEVALWEVSAWIHPAEPGDAHIVVTTRTMSESGPERRVSFPAHRGWASQQVWPAIVTSWL